MDTRQLPAACCDSLSVNSTRTSFPAAIKVSGVTSGPAGGKVANAVGLGDGEAAPVGHLWWAEVEAAGQSGAYVYGVEVEEFARRRGVARAAFAELERVARERGLRFVSLHVFGHNHGARRLYEELGFAPTNLTLRKDLP